jgi:hypothetical protein
MADIAPKPSYRGGFSYDQGCSRTGFKGRFRWRPKSLQNQLIKDILTMAKITPMLVCQGGFNNGQG